MSAQSQFTEQSEIDALRQELAAWRENCRRAEADCAKAIAERDALARRLEASPGMREVISRLRDIRQWLSSGRHSKAGIEVTDLLRRLDRE